MKLLKCIPEFKLPDFKTWRLKLLPKIPFRQIQEQLATLATAKRFSIILTTLILITGLEFILGFNFILGMNHQLIKSNQRYDKKAGVIYQVRTNLANLPVVYNEELSGIAVVSAQSIFNQINREIRQLPINNPNNHELKLFKASLTNIADYVPTPVTSKNYYELWAEVGKAQIYLNQYEKELYVPRQKHVAAEAIHKKIWLNELILLFFVLAGTVYLFLLIIKEGNQHHTAIIHFEDVARKFKRGLIQPGVLPFQTSELQDLQDALSDYLTRLAERYRIILAKIEEFGPSIQQLGEWIGQNDNQHLNIKQNLKGLTEKTYLKLEKFPDLSEQVKHVNADLVISQREAMEIQEFIQQSSDLLYSGPKAIQPFQAQVGEKGQYYQAITGHLKDLQLLLDEIQQTVTSFYGISEQTNLLSLNASIEAARAGEEGDNFSIAATEIEELALKINKASKDLLSLSVLMGKKTTMVIRTLETSLVQNKSEHKHLDEIVDRLNNFVTELNKNLIKIKSYGSMVRDFEAEEQILEKLASILADLKQQSPSNRGRAMAALEVIIDSDKLVASADELADNLTDLKQILAQIQYEPNSEEF